MPKNLIILFVAIAAIQSAQAQSPPPIENYLPPPDVIDGPPTSFVLDSSGVPETITNLFCADYDLQSEGNSIEKDGTVRVCNSDTHLYVGAYAKTSFKLGGGNKPSIRMWIGTADQSLPYSDQSGPRFNNFPIGASQTDYYWSYSTLISNIPIDAGDPVLSCRSYFYIYLRAQVEQGVVWGGICSTSFGFHCRMGYAAKCSLTADTCLVNPLDLSCPPLACQTAFARGPYVFGPKSPNPTDLTKIVSQTEKSRRWGWAIYYTKSVQPLKFQIYAGAGLNLISKGTLIGTALITYNTDLNQVDVNFQINLGVLIQGYHVHLSASRPQIVSAPGRYSNIEYFEPPVNTISTISATYTEPGMWIIIHLNSCYSALYTKSLETP